MKVAELRVVLCIAAIASLALRFGASAEDEIPFAQSPVYILAGTGEAGSPVIPINKGQKDFKLVTWVAALENEKVPDDVISKLKKLGSLPFFGEPRFQKAVEAVLGEDGCAEHFETIKKYALGHPHPQPRLAGSKNDGQGNVTSLTTGSAVFRRPDVSAFDLPPGTNQLPTIYENLRDGYGREMFNTLPATKTVPYNLHDGEPVVSDINPISPTDDLLRLFNEVVAESQKAMNPPPGEQPIDAANRHQAILDNIQMGIDILEGNPIPNRYYSGFPLLHYNGPNKIKDVYTFKDDHGTVLGGNVDVHQIWYDNHIESDLALVNPANVWDVPWTMTYTIDVLNRGHDDFSPFGIFTDDPSINNPGFKPPPSSEGVPQIKWPAQPAGLAHYGMDQSFFPMDDGTRTVVKIKMPPGKYYHLVYTWGWRMHPPRIQSTDRATKKFGDKTLVEWEVSVFGENPQANEKAKVHAINQIGDFAPAKRMWNHLRTASNAANAGNYKQVIQSVGLADTHDESARLAYFDWRNRGIMRLPRGVEVDPDSDLTILFANNTIYGQFRDGGITDFPSWDFRGSDLKVTIYNGDHFQHMYVNVDFGGSRGWENLYKSSVQVGGSGCWFTFGRANWWINNTGSGPVVCPGATPGKMYEQSVKKNVQHFNIKYNYEPSRRLRFYQFDPTHHDVAILSIH